MNTKEGVTLVVNDIYKKHGEVKPSQLVSAARQKDSPAHSAFEWNDKTAGHQYRLWQARQWIRRVEITIEDRKEQLVHVPIIRDGDSSQEGYYKPYSVVVKDKSEYDAAREYVQTQVSALRNSLDKLVSAASVSRVKKPNIKRANRALDIVEASI